MTTQSFRREMGFWAAFALVVNLQLGSAMFLLPRSLSQYGIWGVFSWLITGCGAMALCHLFSKLAILVPMQGGPHVYIRKAFGDRWGYYAGWTYWIMSWVSSLPLIIVGTGALEHLVGNFGQWGRLAAQISILWALMRLNIRGAKLSGIGEIIFSILKVIPLIAIPIMGMYFFDSSILNAPVTMAPSSALLSASLLTFWGFVGLEAGTTIANSVKNSQKVIPAALFWGTLLVIALYFMNTVSIFGIVPRAVLETSTNAYSPLFQHTLGSGWDTASQLLVCIMCFGSLNSWILASGQVAMSAANSGLFPAVFSPMPGTNSPVMGVKITTACLVCGLLLMWDQSLASQIDGIIHLSVTALIMLYVVVIFAVIHFIRRQEIKNSVSVVMSLLVSFIFCALTLGTTDVMALLGGLLVPLGGYVCARLLRWPIH